MSCPGARGSRNSSPVGSSAPCANGRQYVPTLQLRARCATLCAPETVPERAMPSFDIVSEVDSHELTNAVDQANRELGTRFDFKGVDAKFVLEDQVITQSAPSDFQLKQMNDILRARLIARGIDVRCLEF